MSGTARTERLAIARERMSGMARTEKTCALEKEPVYVAIALMPIHTVHVCFYLLWRFVFKFKTLLIRSINFVTLFVFLFETPPLNKI